MRKKSSATGLKDPSKTISNRAPIGMKTKGISGSRQNAGINTSTASSAKSSSINEMTNENVVLKSGWMTKRSQLKSIFSFTNYRERYFQLTKSGLIYYENAPPITTGGSSTHAKNKKERGRVNIRDIRVVEPVTIKDRGNGGSKNEDQKYANSFQIGYKANTHHQHSTKNNQHLKVSNIPDHNLIVVARSDIERDEWIASLRNLCRANPNLSDKYHPTIATSSGRWLCCGEPSVVSRSSTSSLTSGGCQPITWTPRQTKSDPVPPLPQDAIRSSPLVVNSSSTSHHIHGSSHQDLVDGNDNDDDEDDEDDVDSFDLTPELQRAGGVHIHGDKLQQGGLNPSSNNNGTTAFLEVSTDVQQQHEQQVLTNLNQVSSPMSPAVGTVASASVSAGGGVGVPVIPGAAAGGVTGAGTGKIVVAVYPFTAIEEGDLTLTKGTYIVA